MIERRKTSHSGLDIAVEIERYHGQDKVTMTFPWGIYPIPIDIKVNSPRGGLPVSDDVISQCVQSALVQVVVPFAEETIRLREAGEPTNAIHDFYRARPDLRPQMKEAA